MKNAIFLFISILVVSCKKHEDAKPEFKYGVLSIDYTGSESSPIKSELYLNLETNGPSSKYYYPASGTSVSFHLDTLVRSGQKISFGAHTTYPGGGAAMYATHTIKLTFNNQAIAEQSFPNSNGVVINSYLQVIE
jgi:hypothetical protein